MIADVILLILKGRAVFPYRRGCFRIDRLNCRAIFNEMRDLKLLPEATIKPGGII
jgi:hypothetical protein